MKDISGEHSTAEPQISTLQNSSCQRGGGRERGGEGDGGERGREGGEGEQFTFEANAAVSYLQWNLTPHPKMPTFVYF